MKEIPLTQNKIALVDDEDYERVTQYKWHARKQGNTYYAMRNIDKKSKQYMHRFILNISDDKFVDHKDHNGLNNQKYVNEQQGNIRKVNHQQNGYNKQKRERTSSQYKGVTWNKNRKKWQAQIEINNNCIYLGLFNDEIAAALVYDKAAIIHFGEYANLNFEIGHEISVCP